MMFAVFFSRIPTLYRFEEVFMNRMHPFTLSFADRDTEREFVLSTLPRTRLQGRTAMLVGMVVYLLCGLLDPRFVPPDVAEEVWNIRYIALFAPLTVLALSFTPLFERMAYLLLASVGLAAGIGIIAILILLPIESTFYYYPMMALVTFYTYNFIGTRFVYALCVDVSLLLAYNIIFGWIMDYPAHILLAHDAILVSANLIGGTAGYLAERQGRLLYLRERELDEERRYHMQKSLHDPLTGLPNRELLYDRIEHSMALALREGKIHCGFFLDLDGFKKINDTLGHKAGDAVLKHVAQILAPTVREIDTVARIGGDEFFILVLDVADEHKASAIAQKILDALNRPIPGVPKELELGSSIGICLFPYPGMNVTDIIHRADQAMYAVKCGGKNGYSFVEGDREGYVD